MATYIPKKMQARHKAEKPKASRKSNKTSIPLSSMVDKNSSATVRQIENGFLVSESGYTGKGKNQKWVNKEYFSQTNPLESVGKVKFGKK